MTRYANMAELMRAISGGDAVLVTDGYVTTVRPVGDSWSEDDFHASVIAEIESLAVNDARYSHVFHPANGGFRHKATARRLRAMGVRRGILDLYLIYPNWQGYGGWACELKVGRNQPTQEQKAEMEYLRSVNWSVHCFWDNVQPVIDSLRTYLGDA